MSILPAITVEDEENDMCIMRYPGERWQRLDDEFPIMSVGGFGPYVMDSRPF